MMDLVASDAHKSFMSLIRIFRLRLSKAPEMSKKIPTTISSSLLSTQSRHDFIALIVDLPTLNTRGELSCDFFPAIEVSKNAKICLSGFQINNSIPNINDKCNQIGFIYYEGKRENTTNFVYSLPTGSYELRVKRNRGDVSGGYVDDCRITQIDYHSFLPHSTSALFNNDKVRIALHNTESYILMCESYIYIEGIVTKPVDLIDDIRFINNGLAFLFFEMKYELNGIQIQKLVNPGITSTLKEYCLYNKSDIVSHYNTAWDDDVKNVNRDFIESGVFNGCINLKDLFGFCEDYKRILINCNQQLILNRASLDMNAIKQYKNNKIVVDAPKLKDVKINIIKILWKMPIVKVSDKEKIQLLKVKSYYGRDNVTPLLTRSDFKKGSPIIVVDMSRQNDNVKTSTVDLRIEMETEEEFPASTSAYCLILHDQIVTYNPFNGEVRTL
ncbi:hypothetical protein QTP88_026123 [Uroleucon formosanum]